MSNETTSPKKPIWKKILYIILIVIPILILISSETVMGKHRAGSGMKLALWAVLAFGLVTTYLAIAELVW